MALRQVQLFQWQTFVEHLYNKECEGRVVIDDKLKAAIDTYYEQYGVRN